MPVSDEALESLRGARVAAQLSGASGRMLQVEGVMRPVIGLREGAMRGRALVFQAAERLDSGALRPVAPDGLNVIDLERIDLAMAEKGLAALEPAEPEAGRPPLVFLPAALSSVRNPRFRRKLLRLAGKAQASLKMIAVCEVYAIDRGVPTGVLRETAGVLKPIFRGVLARAPADPKQAARVADCGFSGAAVEAGALIEAADEQAMLRTVLALQRIGPGVMFHGVRSVKALTAARAAGASWASLDIVPGALEGARLAAHAQKEAATQKETAAQSPGPPLEVETL